jgi:hypothetical protein
MSAHLPRVALIADPRRRHLPPRRSGHYQKERAERHVTKRRPAHDATGHPRPTAAVGARVRRRQPATTCGREPELAPSHPLLTATLKTHTDKDRHGNRARSVLRRARIAGTSERKRTVTSDGAQTQTRRAVAVDDVRERRRHEGRLPHSPREAAAGEWPARRVGPGGAGHSFARQLRGQAEARKELRECEGGFPSCARP